MRWSFWPVSISVHVVIVFAMFIVPLTADVSWPVPAPLHPLTVATKVAPVPPEVVQTVPARSGSVAPREAPAVLAAPLPIAPSPGDVLVPPMPGYGTGPIDHSLIGPSTVSIPRLPIAPP